MKCRLLTFDLICKGTKLAITRLVRSSTNIIRMTISRLTLGEVSSPPWLSVSGLVQLSRLESGHASIFIWLTEPWIAWLVEHGVP